MIASSKTADFLRLVFQLIYVQYFYLIYLILLDLSAEDLCY